MNNPFVSIILPNYNHERYLKKRFDSITQQTFQNFELILLDDFSTDNSIALLNKYSHHPKVSHCFFNKKNSGSTFKQWEKGIEIAKGKYIWIAESDDYSDIFFLESAVIALENNNEINFHYCQSYIVNEDNTILGSLKDSHIEGDGNNIWSKNFIMTGKEFIANHMIKQNYVPNASAVVFRKDSVDLKWFDYLKEFKMAGDWLFWMLLATNGKISFAHKELNYFRTHSLSTRKHKTFIKKKDRIIEEILVFNYLNKITKTKYNRKIYNQTLLRKWMLISPAKKIITNRVINTNLIITNPMHFIKLLKNRFFNN